MTYPIIIPLSHCGGKLKDDTELRFALRSLDKHFKDPFKVVIVGKHVPAWLVGAEHVYSGEGLKTALIDAAKAYPDGFFWWYDDLTMLRDSTGEEMKVTPAIKHWMSAKTGWANSLEKIHKRLIAEGRPAYDYSRPHGPYWFDKAMVDEGFADWPGMKGKFPWESWILSKHDWPRRFGVVKQYYGRFNGEPPAHSFLLNYNDAGNTPELRAWLERRFPDASRFEKVAEALNRAAMVRFRLKGEADGPVYQGQNVVKPCRTCGKKRAATPAVKIEVHTIRFGDRWWLRLCAPTLNAWCAKHGHSLKVWGTGEIDPAYPEPKFCQIDMLRGFLEGNSDWMIYVDSDVYVDEAAPAHPGRAPGFWIREDLPGGGPRDFHRWCKKHGKTAPGWQYRNAGVWMCDRASAAALLEVIAPPYLSGCMEQHQWNWWLSQAAAKGLRVGVLDPAWNAWAYESEKAAFYHIAGKKKVKRLEMFRANGRIPKDHHKPMTTDFPKAFDFEPYRFTLCGTTAPMDEIHIHMLRESLRRGAPDQVAVEIGSWRGASTSAFIDAINCGEVGHLHIIETRPKPELHKVMAMCQKPECITLHTMPTWDVKIPIKSADFVFIDGDHKWAALADTLQAMAWDAKVIAMHDTHAWPEVHDCWGAHTAANILKRAVGRTYTEDMQDRAGMLTRRGLMISTRDD